MSAEEINQEAIREVHSIKSIGCFLKKPIMIDNLVERLKAELYYTDNLYKQQY